MQYQVILTKSYWLSTTKYQPVRPHTDPVPPSTNQYRLLLTQHHQVSINTDLYWPSTIKNQPVPPPTYPVPPSTNQYHLLLTQCHHISTSTASYWPSTTKCQPVPTYTVFAWGLQTPAQFTPGLVPPKKRVNFDMSNFLSEAELLNCSDILGDLGQNSYRIKYEYSIFVLLLLLEFCLSPKLFGLSFLCN